VTAADLSGYAAAVLGTVFIWPQVIRVYARRSVEGISGATQLISLAGTMMWLAYGFVIDSVPMVVANANIEIALIAIVAMMVRKGAMPFWKPAAIVVGAMVYCIVVGQIAPTWVGLAGVIIGTPSILPQVWRAIRTERLYGVSVTTNLLLVSMGCAWGIHGYLIGDPVVSYPNLVLIPSASYIAWRAWQSHRMPSFHSAAVTAIGE
jgi:MtN3 and saliva related transmembrane protein